MSPWAPKRPCTQLRCPNLQPCAIHGRRPWHHGQPSASARGYGANWRKLREIVLAEEPVCRECQADDRLMPSTTVDHIVPKAQGGTDERENLRGLCRQHQQRKAGREGRSAQ